MADIGNVEVTRPLDRVAHATTLPEVSRCIKVFWYFQHRPK
jgi:hypothetical protein